MTVWAASAVSIADPQLLHINDGSKQYYGANQIWFQTQWQQRSGCGPTVASHLIWYLSRTKKDLERLCLHDGSNKEGFARLMEDVWQFVTPTAMGLNRTSLFAEGVLRYAAEKDTPLGCRTLEVSRMPRMRPSLSALADFLEEAFAEDVLVAFLNLSNGALRNLESWHWVTLTSYDPQSGMACMYDQGTKQMINLKKWLKTTVLGGGFAALYTKNPHI